MVPAIIGPAAAPGAERAGTRQAMGFWNSHILQGGEFGVSGPRDLMTVS
jgi:hypothetical protein